MQLNRNSLRVIALGAASLPLVLHAAEGSKISFKQTHYKEADGRIGVDYSLLDIKKEFGADYTVDVGLSYDTISGGTPIWVDTVSGASGKALPDGRIAVGEFLEEGGSFTKDAFQYQKIQVEDRRRAITTSVTRRTPDRDEITLGASYSTESDFTSREGSLSYLYNLDASRNQSITVGVSYQSNSAYHLMYDEWRDFHVLNTQIGYTHTLNKTTVGQVNYFQIHQSGDLSNPYQTIIRLSSMDGLYWRAVEQRPNERSASGISASLASKILDNTALQGEYRYYNDDWGIESNTLGITTHTTLDEVWVVSPMVRYYTQSQAGFYKSHESGEVFDDSENGSADERLGGFHGWTYGLGVERKLGEAVSLNLHAASQRQSNGLKMTWLSLGLDYNF
ncbi:MAG: DUF3570 domain-containing protein [Magnetococcales bacterium]|nr:DUF3570 domain-containing protein [Magnetococcales bacterium]